jgi:hypothetical protein
MSDFLRILIPEPCGFVPSKEAQVRALNIFKSICSKANDVEVEVREHVETKDYEVAKGPGHAHRALRARHPDGLVIVHQIGPANAGLVVRMRGETPQWAVTDRHAVREALCVVSTHAGFVAD